MKIKPKHLDHLRTTVSPFLTQERYTEYKQKGLSDRRFRWDALWLSHQSNFVINELYPYLNDEHIDTALRHIWSTK